MATAHVHHDHDHALDHQTETLLTLVLCAGLALAAVCMYAFGRLGKLLHPDFFVPVLAGGIVLAVLVLIRAVAFWKELGELGDKIAHDHHHHEHEQEHKHEEKKPALLSLGLVTTPTVTEEHHHEHGPDCKHDHDHDHHHEHGPDCKHDHKHEHSHSHSHADHDHDHSWWPMRLTLLFIPVALFLANWPNKGYSKASLVKSLNAQKDIAMKFEDSAEDEGPKYDEVVNLTFKELAGAANSKSGRARYDGKIGRLKGQFSPLFEKEFTLFKLKITCCAADAIPLKVRIKSPDALQYNVGEWVEVEGRIRFLKVAGKEEYVPMLRMGSVDNVRPATPDSIEFEI